MFRTLSAGLMAVAFLFVARVEAATIPAVAITEWMYNGDEFVEFTNLSGAPVDFTGWSYDDDSRIPGSVSLSAFGIVAPGESVILAEVAEATFRARWGLAPSVKVIGGNNNNLGRNDEVNLYDNNAVLVDRLTYGDQNLPGTIRTLDISGNPSSLAILGLDTSAGWVLSFVGDALGSYSATGAAFIANPGKFTLVPVPAALPLMLGALAGLAGIRRRVAP